MRKLGDMLAQTGENIVFMSSRSPVNAQWPWTDRFGNRYFENLNATEEVPGGAIYRFDVDGVSLTKF